MEIYPQTIVYTDVMNIVTALANLALFYRQNTSIARNKLFLNKIHHDLKSLALLFLLVARQNRMGILLK